MDAISVVKELNKNNATIDEAINHEAITVEEPEWFNADDYILSEMPSPGFVDDKIIIFHEIPGDMGVSGWVCEGPGGNLLETWEK